MQKNPRPSHEVNSAWRRLALILALLMGLALACSAGQEPDQQSATTAPADDATQNPLYLPEVQSSGGQEAGGAAGEQTAPNTLYLPQVSSGSGQPGGPLLQIEASAPTLKVGETMTVNVQVTGVGNIIYTLSIQDAGTAEAKPLAQVNAANEAQAQVGTSQVLELLSAEGYPETATFILRGKAPGTSSIKITATGEIQGEGGTNPWSGEASQPVTITVTD